MAISPPTDIVLDVARAIDPAAMAAARAELMRKAQGAGASAFSVGADAVPSMPGPGLSRPADAGSLPDASKKFEAMVLQTFIASMMPKNTEGTYGTGMAGEMWKSMMAEKIANVVAEGGGIGIAERVLGDFQMDGEKRVPVAGITPRAALDDTQPVTVATAMVDQIERKLAREIGAPIEPGASMFRE